MNGDQCCHLVGRGRGRKKCLFVVFTSKSKSRYYGCSRQHATRSGTCTCTLPCGLATAGACHSNVYPSSGTSTLTSDGRVATWIEKKYRRLTPRVSPETTSGPPTRPPPAENHNCSIRSHDGNINRLGHVPRRLTFASRGGSLRIRPPTRALAGFATPATTQTRVVPRAE